MSARDELQQWVDGVDATHEDGLTDLTHDVIPADLADKIVTSDDVEWLAKSRNYLQRFAESDPESVADHEALIDARLEAITVADEPDAEQPALDVEIEAEAVDA